MVDPIFGCSLKSRDYTVWDALELSLIESVSSLPIFHILAVWLIIREEIVNRADQGNMVVIDHAAGHQRVFKSVGRLSEDTEVVVISIEESSEGSVPHALEQLMLVLDASLIKAGKVGCCWCS